MKHAVVFAHPNPRSLTAAVAGAYVEAVRGLGHDVLVRDLYRMGFDPRLQASEIPGPDGCVFGQDVQDERAALADADVFAFVYPLWFNAPPAMLKGYLDRVFGSGFGFANVAGGGTEPMLEGRKLISFTLSGAPEAWVRDTGALSALTTLFDQHVGRVCGLSVLDHVHLGDVTPGLTEEAVADLLAAVRRAALDQFAAGSPSAVL
jgi:NAD(P)H dehydrogenase (quinone)